MHVGWQVLAGETGGPGAVLTGARHGSEDPALAVLDRLAAQPPPPLEDVHAADPRHGAHPILIVVVPAPQQHPMVFIIAVDLQGDMRRWHCVAPGYKGTERTAQEQAGWSAFIQLSLAAMIIRQHGGMQELHWDAPGRTWL